MGDSGDIEILEKQVSLLRDLLGRLDRRREERRGGSGEPPVPGESRPETAPPAAAGDGGLRLVGEEEGAEDPAGRKPRFRQKRSWNLAHAPAETPRPEPPVAPAVRRAPRPEPGANGGGGSVPLHLYDQLLRERDDLLVQVMRQHAAEQRLLEERATAEGKAQEIRLLRRELRDKQTARFEDLFGRLHQRLVEVEEIERVLVLRAMELGGSPRPRADPARGSEAEGASVTQSAGTVPRGKKLFIRGHEIVVTTSREMAGGCYSFALLTVDAGGRDAMKGFKATAPTSRDSEIRCIANVLEYLEEQAGAELPGGKLRSSRNLASIRGRQVDIFCDLVGPGNFQAFPFLYDATGDRHIILRFHLQEAITADTAEEARLRCVRRLEAHFDELDAAAEG